MKDFYDFLNTGHFRVTAELYQTRDKSLKDRVFGYLDSSDFSDNGYAIDFIYSEDGVLFINGISDDEVLELGSLITSRAARNCFAAQGYIKYHHVIPSRLLASLFKASLTIDQNLVYFDGMNFRNLTNKIDLVQNDNPIKKIFTTLQEEVNLLQLDGHSYTSNLLDAQEHLKAYLNNNSIPEFIKLPLETLLAKVNRYTSVAQTAMRR